MAYPTSVTTFPTLGPTDTMDGTVGGAPVAGDTLVNEIAAEVEAVETFIGPTGSLGAGLKTLLSGTFVPNASPTLGFDYFMPVPSGDVTGATDTAAFNAAVTALGGATAGAGVIRFRVALTSNTYVLDQSATTAIESPNISVLGAGSNLTYITTENTGTCFSLHSAVPAVANPGVGELAEHLGHIGGFTILAGTIGVTTVASASSVTGITSNAFGLTITFAGAHGALTGQCITLAGFTPSGYNGTWLIDSTTSTTIFILTSANPGTSTVQGTYSTKIGSVAVEWGDSNYDRIDDLCISGYATTGCIGLLLNNNVFVSEKQDMNVEIKHCYIGVMFQVLGGTAVNNSTQVTNSHDYAKYNFKFDFMAANSIGVWVANGATLAGVEMSIVGDFYGGASNSGSILRISGTSTLNSNVKASNITLGSRLFIGTECVNVGLGTVFHQSVTFGPSSQLWANGSLTFHNAVATNIAALSGSVSYSFSGPISGDNTLAESPMNANAVAWGPTVGPLSTPQLQATTGYVDAAVAVASAVVASANNPQTGAYTFVLADAGTEVDYNSASAASFTIPPHSSVAFGLGAIIACRQLGAGQLTIAPGAGVTIHNAVAPTTRAQYSLITLSQDLVTANTWYVDGDA